MQRQANVDEKAKLLSQFEPESNEYAQAAAVAGMALYHVVVGADGKPGEIAVARPIGFGLDENAVESIRKASFSPAMKDGKPVPVLVDLGGSVSDLLEADVSEGDAGHAGRGGGAEVAGAVHGGAEVGRVGASWAMSYGCFTAVLLG